MTQRLLCVWTLMVMAAAAQPVGRIQGVIRDTSGSGVAGIAVQLLRNAASVETRSTDAAGRFAFENLAPGKYVVSFTANDIPYRLEAEVTPGAAVSLEKEIPMASGLLESVTVYAASRETESLIHAPAAITRVDPKAGILDAGAGQIPGMLAGVPGAEVTQNGLYDYNFNVRGFNAMFNRRIGVLIDGRDPTIPLLGNQEWSSLAFLSDDLATMEVLRGPTAALYGQNAYNGVINLTTEAPRDVLGGELRFTAGQLDTFRVDGRTALRLGKNWYALLAGGFTHSNDFSRSRNVSVEYPGLPLEAIPLPTRHVNLDSGMARFDKYFGENRMLTLEVGAQSLSGVVFLTGVGRALSDATRTWTRAHLALPGWDFLFYSNTRDSPNEPALGSGVPIWDADRNYQGETQMNRRLGRTDLLAGGNFRYETVDTANDQGVQSLLSHAVAAHRGAAFAQVRQTLAERLVLSAAMRVDASTLYNTQYSPRASILYRFGSTSSLYASLADAFEAPNYAELFLFTPAGRPVDLSAIETALAPLLGGTSLGLSSVPVLGIGNEHLQVERIRSAEAGYKQMLRNRTLLTVDYYWNWMRDFISDLAPGVDPDYPPYVAPASLGPAQALVSQTIGQLVPGITNGPGGVPWIVYSQANAGRVSSQGVEAAASGWLGNRWQYSANYSWFYYSLNDAAARAVVHPNAPQHKAFASLAYVAPRFMANLRYRWVDDFYFATGLFHGPVPTYNLVDLGAAYDLSAHWRVGVNVSNLLNNPHYEIFGGDILKRLALGFVAYSWK
jgi:outer membrane receptor protein involved in Fe transport